MAKPVKKTKPAKTINGYRDFLNSPFKHEQNEWNEWKNWYNNTYRKHRLNELGLAERNARRNYADFTTQSRNELTQAVRKLKSAVETDTLRRGLSYSTIPGTVIGSETKRMTTQIDKQNAAARSAMDTALASVRAARGGLKKMDTRTSDIDSMFKNSVKINKDVVEAMSGSGKVDYTILENMKRDGLSQAAIDAKKANLDYKQKTWDTIRSLYSKRHADNYTKYLNKWMSERYSLGGDEKKYDATSTRDTLGNRLYWSGLGSFNSLVDKWQSPNDKQWEAYNAKYNSGPRAQIVTRFAEPPKMPETFDLSKEFAKNEFLNKDGGFENKTINNYFKAESAAYENDQKRQADLLGVKGKDANDTDYYKGNKPIQANWAAAGYFYDQNDKDDVERFNNNLPPKSFLGKYSQSKEDQDRLRNGQLPLSVENANNLVTSINKYSAEANSLLQSNASPEKLAALDQKYPELAKINRLAKDRQGVLANAWQTGANHDYAGGVKNTLGGMYDVDTLKKAGFQDGSGFGWIKQDVKDTWERYEAEAHNKQAQYDDINKSLTDLINKSDVQGMSSYIDAHPEIAGFVDLRSYGGMEGFKKEMSRRANVKNVLTDVENAIQNGNPQKAFELVDSNSDLIDFGGIEYPEWMKYQSKLDLSMPKDKMESAAVSLYFSLKQRQPYIEAPDLSKLAKDDQVRLLSSLDNISKRTAVDVANMNEQSYELAKKAGDIDAVDAYELYKSGNLKQGELTPNQKAVNSLLDKAWAYTGADTPFKQTRRGWDTGNIGDIVLGGVGELFSPFTILDSSSKWFVKELLGGAPTTDPDEALFGYSMADYNRDLAAAGRGIDYTKEIAKIPIVGELANNVLDLAMSPSTWLIGGIADDVMKGIKTAKAGYSLRPGLSAYDTWADANRLMRPVKSESLVSKLNNGIRALKNRFSLTELDDLANIRFIDDIRGINNLDEDELLKIANRLGKNADNTEDVLHLTSDVDAFDLHIGDNVKKITGQRAEQLTAAVNDKLVAMGRKMTTGDRFVVFAKGGKYVDSMPYTAELGKKLGDVESGSIARVFQVERVGYNGEKVIYTDVTDDVVKQAYTNADDANFAAQMAGKEGVGGENKYDNVINEDASSFAVGKYDYRKVFFDKHPELEGKVIVHHSIEQQVMRRFPGLFTEADINSYERLRGIPIDKNNSVHLSMIRKEWNQFYKDIARGKIVLSQQSFVEMAKRIDELYGDLFLPKIK